MKKNNLQNYNFVQQNNNFVQQFCIDLLAPGIDNNKNRPWVDTRSPDGLNGIGSPME